MPVITPNANFSQFRRGVDPLAQGVQSLADIFSGDSEVGLNNKKSDLLELQIQAARDKVRTNQTDALSALEAEQSLQENIGVLSELFTPTDAIAVPEGQQGPPTAAVSVDEKLSAPGATGALNNTILDLTLAGGFKPNDIAALIRSVSANAGVGDENLTRAFVGAGGSLSPNEALSVERQDEIRKQNQANEVAKIMARPRSRGVSVTSPDGTKIQIGGTGESVPLKNIADASTFTALAQSQQIIKRVKGKILKPTEAGGFKVDRAAVFKGNIPGLSQGGFSPTAIPFTEGTEIVRDFQEVISNKIFAQTGKTAPEAQIARAMRMFLPTISDTDEAIVNKIESLENWTGDVVDLIAPGVGQGAGETFRDENNNIDPTINPDAASATEELRRIEEEIKQIDEQLGVQ